MRVPAATYRFQLNRDFGFRDVTGLVDYLRRLGISDVYASPILQAQKGSTHGYDVTDPTRLDPEIGAGEDFDRLTGMLRERGMGLLVDFVPNHMAASDENPWWRDVQEKGEDSAYALYFDTDWLSHHGLDSRELKYRRFFDIGEMVGIREEYPPAFDELHRFLLELTAAGKVTGVRLDHIDGLYRPGRYLKLLQEKLSEAAGERQFYILVEKILSGDETLPESWPVSGTTGYEFAGAMDALFIDPAGKESIKQAWLAVTGMPATFAEFVYQKKLQVMRDLFPAEIKALARWLARLQGFVNLEDAEQTLRVLTASLPVYRTYVTGVPVRERDKRYLGEAFHLARERGEAPEAALDFLERVLRLDYPPGFDEKEQFTWQDFVWRWQQMTGSIMAKGYEDTALYGYTSLVSLNEVGGEPDSPGLTMKEFHGWNQNRLVRMPFTLNATTTHDTKRSEDVRARLSVLSEVPGEWNAHLQRWRAWNEGKKTMAGDKAAPEANTEILFYQSMVGIWPLDPAEEAGLPQRLKDYILKAVREAKEQTNWVDQNKPYEEALMGFIDKVCVPGGNDEFMADFRSFLDSISFCGALNSLAQLLLKITSPGVPDFYRGQELWDFSLVDPDNRRPVDFSRRLRLMDELEREPPPVYDLLGSWKDGRIKMYVTKQGLKFRREHRRLFEEGAYLPLATDGANKKDVCAFARRHGEDWAVVIVPRFFQKLGLAAGYRPLAETWLDGRVLLPPEAPQAWMNVIGTSHVNVEGGSIALADIFREVPLALLRPAG